MKKLKNIVIINDFDYIQGGASKVAIQTANIIKKNNPTLNVYFFSGCTNNSSDLNNDITRLCTNQGESLKNGNKIKGIINNLYNFRAEKQLKKLLSNLDKESTIVHIHGWTKSISCSIFNYLFKNNYKTILTLHDYFIACGNGGFFNYKLSTICQYTPLSLKCITCNCDSRNYFYKIFRILRLYIQNHIVKLNRKIPNVIIISNFSEKILLNFINKETKIYRLNNPIDLDEETFIADYKKNNYYLYVGRICKEKGIDIFCEAVTASGKQGIVVGDGPELNYLKSKYKNIKFVGWKNSEKVKMYMKFSKALVVPSIWYEGAPLTPLEALQYGIPVISSNCNATVDYLQNNKNGIIYNSLNELINILKSDLNINFDLSFKKNNYYDNLMKIYKEIMEENK